MVFTRRRKKEFQVDEENVKKANSIMCFADFFNEKEIKMESNEVKRREESKDRETVGKTDKNEFNKEIESNLKEQDENRSHIENKENVRLYCLESEKRSPLESSLREREMENVNIKFFNSSNLPREYRIPIFNLMKENMKAMYEKCSWGWQEAEKEAELFDEMARYLIVTSTSITGNEFVEGFAHFRFILDGDEDPQCGVLYLYEIQLSSKVQGKGLGNYIISVLKEVGHSMRMKKLKLTCFHSNVGALSFYMKKVGFSIDETSPSKFEGSDADYEILSCYL